MKAKQRFSDEILADFRESKGPRIRVGTRPQRFIGIWVVVVNDRVFVRSWSVRPRGWYQTFLEEPSGTRRHSNGAGRSGTAGILGAPAWEFHFTFWVAHMSTRALDLDRFPNLWRTLDAGIVLFEMQKTHRPT